MRLLRLVLFALLTRAQYLSFNLREGKGGIEISKNGRTTNGRIFTYDKSNQTAIYHYIIHQLQTKFKGEFKFAQTVIFTIEEINRNSDLLPGITLGYSMYTGCGTLNLLRGVMSAVTGMQTEHQEKSCTVSRVQALIGHSSSGPSREISKLITPFSIPMINHLATCECLSKRNKYSFFRTMLTDYFQITVLVQLMKYSGWTWVEMVYRAETYSKQGPSAFKREAKEKRICLKYLLQLSGLNSQIETPEFVETITSPTSKVPLVFMSKLYCKVEHTDTERTNLTGIYWIGSEAWITSQLLLTEERAEILQRAMDFVTTVTKKSQIPSLTQFLLNLRPSDTSASAFQRSFWEMVFDCSLPFSQTVSATFYTCAPLSPLQALSDVFGALLTLAHVIHTLVQSYSHQDVNTIHMCPNKHGLQPQQVPRSVCTESCLPKCKKAINSRKPVSFFDCRDCPPEDIINQKDGSEYIPCLLENWFTEDGNQSTYDGWTMGFLLTAFFIFGIFLTVTGAVISFWNRDNVIARSHNSELKFLLLFSLKQCFLCSLTFISRPTEWSCMLRHTAFGITFVLCISCVLGKTIVVLMAFRATLPGSNVMKWFRPLQQRLSILAFILVQGLICIVWLTISPPSPNMSIKHHKEKIILECDVRSALGFWAGFGYIGPLSVLCFALAFVAHKLHFGGYRFLSLCMLLCYAVWMAFNQMYIRVPTKYALIIKIFTASSVSNQ